LLALAVNGQPWVAPKKLALKYKDKAERQVDDFVLKSPPLASNVFWNSGCALNKLRGKQNINKFKIKFKYFNLKI
jgi:hypothetical protein